MTLEDAFRILKIKPTDNKKIIVNQYRKLTLQFHPDRNNDIEAIKIYELIKKAYELVSLYHITSLQASHIKKVNEITKADIEYKMKLKEHIKYRQSIKEQKENKLKNKSIPLKLNWLLIIILIVLFYIIWFK